MPKETACDLVDLADSVPSTLFLGAGSPCKSKGSSLVPGMYTYSRFYIIFNRSLKLLSLGTHRFGLPTKDMPLFQTHSRGNCDESSETRIFPSTTN